jgi:hypothetical protein
LALLSGSKPDSSSACSKKKILDFTRFVLRAQDCLNFINVFCYQVVKRTKHLTKTRIRKCNEFRIHTPAVLLDSLLLRTSSLASVYASGSQEIETVLELIFLGCCAREGGLSGHLHRIRPGQLLHSFGYSVCWYTWLVVSDICVYASWKAQFG